MKNNVILYDNYGSVIANGVNYEWRGDFLGFTIGNTHSSELGIVRVSDGSRYKEDYIPNFNDVTATVPGKDGAYYFGSNYTQRTFTIKFAFDNLTDSQLRKLRQILGKKEPQDLIFDETPYKIYTVKANGQPNLSYVGFDDEESRVYKGEGEVNFIAYYPFARSRYKYLEDYNNANIPEWRGAESNLNEWKNSSGIISKNTLLGRNHPVYGDKIDIYNTSSNRIQLYNPGDMGTPCKIMCNVEDFYSFEQTIGDKNTTNPTFLITINKENNNDWTNVESYSNSFITLDKDKLQFYQLKSILIDSEKRIIYGSNVSINNTTTVEELLQASDGKIYNDCIFAGDFFNIPIINKEDSVILGVLSPPRKTVIKEDNTTITMADVVKIDYQYIYY